MSHQRVIVFPASWTACPGSGNQFYIIPIWGIYHLVNIQNSYWKRVDFPIQKWWIFPFKMVIFHSKLLVYQRVYPISPNSSGQFTGKHRTEPGPGGPGHLKTHCFRRGANGTSNLKGPRVWRRRGCAPCFFECYNGPGSKFNPQLGVISKLVGGFNHLEKY